MHSKAWLAALAGALGVGLRLRELLSRRSLWLDEAMLANNIVVRSWLELTEPLSDNQGAPVGFLWAQRAMVQVFGNNEWALRAVPFAAGVAVLGLTWLVARRLASARAAAVAVLLCAICPPLVRYSTEVKQYASDVAVALLVTLLALRAVDGRGRRGGLVAWGGTAAAAVWFSHFAVFVVAGTGLVLLVAAGRRRAVAVAALAPALSFVGAYVVSLRELSANDVQRDYWMSTFADSAADLPGWMIERVGRLYQDAAGFRPAVVAGVLSVVGLVLIARRTGRRDAAVLFAPLLVVAAAAVVRAYPMDGRLVLAAAPVLTVAVAAATDGAGTARAFLGAGLVVLVAGWLGPAADVVRSPTTIAELRPVLEEVADQARPGDHVYVHDVTEPPARYYGRLLGLRPERRLVWQPAGPACAAGIERDALSPSGGSSRAWVVYAYRLSVRPADEAALVYRRFDALARRLTTIRRPGASAVLYEFGAPPSAPPAPPAAGDLSCLGAFPLS